MSRARRRLSRLDESGVPLLLARLLLGGVMISYAVPKIIAPGEFLKEIYNYHIMPEEPAYLVNLVAVVIPWIELLGSVVLILGVLRRGAATMFTGLLLFFTAAVLFRAYGLYQAGGVPFCDIRFDCGCGHGPVFICSKTLENVGLILLAAYAGVSRSARLTVLGVWSRYCGPGVRSGATN